MLKRRRSCPHKNISDYSAIRFERTSKVAINETYTASSDVLATINPTE